MRHVIWDWNGTLFDDLHLVVEAVNRGLATRGVGPITLDDYRDHYTRPVVDFYVRLLGRPVDEAEWRHLDEVFHRAYAATLQHARLAPDAEEALRSAERAGVTQSLLSMFPHDELVPLVQKLGIDRYLSRIDGLRGATGSRKVGYLEDHMAELIGELPGEVRPAEVLVVGDTPDDAEAAAQVGARCVLYESGSHHRRDLEATGAPVADSLVQALHLGGVLTQAS